MSRVRVKICGITRAEDAAVAAREGADAIGLVFYAGSARAVDVMQAREIVRRLPPFVCKVGLFVDADREFVERVAADAPLDLLQFHGEETPEFCRMFRLPYIKAVRMRDGVDLPMLASRYGDATGILVDSYVAGEAGGTGVSFEWNLVSSSGLQKPLILAGGLTADNIAAAVRKVRPYAVDVSGGVESTKGVKDPAKISRFMDQIRRLTEDRE
ncbi:MAG: phosphoribosylanthranilate isomerase [Gammaproteobacteria bacterium]|nr:MAG: phosphoribosylanthranilate isomerase [Gammaproteobacteria bacterium]